MCYDSPYDSLASLKADAPLIVIGIVADQQIVYGRTGRVPSTISRIEVQRTLKGEEPRQHVVHVSQFGDPAVNTPTDYMRDFPVLRLGTAYLLFLNPTPQRNIPDVDGDIYAPVGPQGVYPIDEQGAVHSLSDGAAAMGVPVHNVPLTDFVRQVQAA